MTTAILESYFTENNNMVFITYFSVVLYLLAVLANQIELVVFGMRGLFGLSLTLGTLQRLDRLNIK